MLLIRDANENDIPAIESMVADFVKGHPAETHPRSSQTLRAAYFSERPVAHLLLAERNGQIVGMAQWTLIHDMFWGMFGAEAAWLYVRPDCRGAVSSPRSPRGSARKQQQRARSFCTAAAVRDLRACTNE
jgi:GNAT superfamily N-acetyltransferase